MPMASGILSPGHCGQVNFSGESGVVSSPGLEQRNHYNENQNYRCDYRISVERGRTIHLIFTIFAFNDPFEWTPSIPICADDYMEVYDGPSTDLRYLMYVNGPDPPGQGFINQKLCGANLPSDISTTGRTVILKFRRFSEAPQRTHFRVEWRTVHVPIDFPGCGISPLSESELNRRSASMNKRIVGGEDAAAYSMPYVCRLRHDIKRCTGTLVRNFAGHFYLITAAHCVDPDPNLYLSGQTRVHCGSHLQHENTLEFAVTNVTQHEDFVYGADVPYDIAVLALNPQFRPEHITNRIQVQAACITNEKHSPQENGTAVGWGLLRGHNAPQGALSTDTLQQLNVTILSNGSTCTDRWTPLTFYSNLQLCVSERALWDYWGRYYGTGGICSGDSGGPLFTLRDRKLFLVGVASRRIRRCGGSLNGDVYEDVFAYRAWIDRNINVPPPTIRPPR